MITFKFDKLSERKLKAEFFGSADKIVKATGKALSDTTKQMRTIASTEIRKEILMAKKKIDRRIQRIFMPQPGGNTIAGIRIHTGRPISLSALTRKARQTKKGVTYEAKRGKKVLIPSAFGPKITKLHGSVYVRQGKTRLPIAIKQYLDLAGDWNAQATTTKVTIEAQSLFPKNLKRRLNELNLREQGKIK